MTAFLRLEEVSAGYPGKPGVVRHLSLTLEADRWTLVLGPNGAGKSTLLRLLVGWLRPEAGTVLLEGRPVERWPARERAGRLGYLPQIPGTAFAFTVEEVVAQGRWRFGTPGPVAPYLEALHLVPLARRPLNALSGGERQLAFLARTLAQEPAFFLLDEPTAHLDPAHKHLLWQTLARLRQEGRGGILVSHDPVLPCGLFHRVIGLKAGRILWEAPGVEALEPGHLERLFGVPLEVVRRGRFCALLPGGGGP